jgi:CheY-like chemotaxis protein
MGTTPSTAIFAQRDGASMAADKGISVLLVEDNPTDVDITKRALTRSGTLVRLCIARDGEEAMAVLEHGRASEASPTTQEFPRLVLLDLRLPRIDGRDILKRIKEDPELCIIPVAVLSAASGERPLLECMALGANMYYVKPIMPEDVTSLIAAVQKYWEIFARLRGRSAAPKSED